MASKRKREDEKPSLYATEALRKLLVLDIGTCTSAEIAVLYLMGRYKFDLSLLQRSLSGM
jgi:hypothetical protein